MIRPPPTVTLFPYTTLFRSKKDATKIPEDIVKAADDLQKKVDAAAEKFIRPRQALGNAGPPLEWKPDPLPNQVQDRKSTRLNSSHQIISYAVFCLKKKSTTA